jgi:hypothetical protein
MHVSLILQVVVDEDAPGHFHQNPQMVLSLSDFARIEAGAITYRFSLENGWPKASCTQ